MKKDGGNQSIINGTGQKMFEIERSRVRNPKKEQERAIRQEAHSYTEEPPSDALWRVGDGKPDEEEESTQ